MSDKDGQLMPYTPEQKEDYKAMLASMLVLNPKLSIRAAKVQIDKQYAVELGKDFIGDMLREIHLERASRFTEVTKDTAMAEMEDLVGVLVQMLRGIIQSEEIVFKDPTKSIETKIFSQANRIKAIATIFNMYERMTNLKMDLGIFERQLGRWKGDIRYIDMVQALKEYRDAQSKKQQPDQSAASGLTA